MAGRNGASRRINESIQSIIATFPLLLWSFAFNGTDAFWITTPRPTLHYSHKGYFYQHQIGHFQRFASTASGTTEKDTVDDCDSIKSALLRLALVSGRGAWSRPSETTTAADWVSRLEAFRSNDETKHLSGTWELVLSDVEPFRASVFFLALASAVEANLLADASDGALTVHSLATGGGEVGRVAHVITSSEEDDDGDDEEEEDRIFQLHSLVELRSASLPSLPLALTGTVISSGELVLDDNNNNDYDLSLRNTTVQNNRVKYGLPSEGGLQPNNLVNNLFDFVADQVVPSGDIFAQVLDPLGGGQTVKLECTYVDDDLLLWRTPQLGNHYFLFARGSSDNWPEMDDMKKRQSSSSSQSSPIGSAFALGMLNPFFSRRAGVKQS